MKRIVTAVWIGLLLAACQPSKPKSGECIIEGTLTGVEDGTELMLMRKYERISSCLVRDTVKDGKFSFTVRPLDGKVEKMSLIHDNLKEGKFSMSGDFYVAPGERVEISGNNDRVYTWRVKSDIEEQQIHDQLVGNDRKLEERHQHILSENIRLRYIYENMEEQQEAQVLLDSLRKLTPELWVLNDSIAIHRIEVMKQMPVSEVWITHLRKLCGIAQDIKQFVYKNEKYPPYHMELKKLYQRLSAEQRRTPLGKEIAQRLFPPKAMKEGDALADGDLYDLQGNIHHLADYKGKYLLIDFWSSGCAPCQKALPEMRRVAETWKEVLHVISISTDTKEIWKQASEKENLTWINLNDLQGITGIYAHYGIKGIPHYVIASPEGEILHVWEGYGDGIIEKKLKEWVKRK